MQLAPSTQLPDGLLAATLLLSRKPRHGFPSKNPALTQGIDERNCTAALGLRASSALNALRPTEHNGSYDLTNPQSFNRYAYVLNNPLSFTDPSGLDYGYDCGDNCVGVVGTDDNDFECWWCMEYGWPPSGPSTPYYPPSKPTPPAPPVVAPKSSIKQKICSALPSGRTTGVSGGLGGVGSVGGGGEIVINYNSGQVSAFGFGGGQVGWNGGASGSVYTGFVYGLNGSNSNYSGGFTGVNGGAGLGGFAARSSGGLTAGASGLLPTSGVTAAGVSFGGGLLSGATGGVTATNYTNPFQFGSSLSAVIRSLNPLDSLLYAAAQVCK